MSILGSEFEFNTKDEARSFFNKLRLSFIDYNYSEWQSEKFKSVENDIKSAVSGARKGIDAKVDIFLKAE